MELKVKRVNQYKGNINFSTLEWQAIVCEIFFPHDAKLLSQQVSLLIIVYDYYN